MLRNKWFMVCVSCLIISFGAFAQGTADEKSGESLHIDIPTKLQKANVVIDMGHLVFKGDAPFRSETSICSQVTFATGTQTLSVPAHPSGQGWSRAAATTPEAV